MCPDFGELRRKFGSQDWGGGIKKDPDKKSNGFRDGKGECDVVYRENLQTHAYGGVDLEDWNGDM